jgi:tripartite-type tricarboxylate transporter receptor subunit TctC
MYDMIVAIPFIYMQVPGGKMRRARGVISAWLATVLLVFAPIVSAQDWPTKPIRLIVPFAPGGGTDILARLLVPKLVAALGQQIIVENRPGAASIIGTQMVAQAAPDGYTLLMVDSTFMINPGLRSQLPYNSLKDFAPVIHLAAGPVILVAHPSLAAKNVRELIAQAKAQPNSLFYGSGGNGSSTHLAGELFNLAAGTRISHVPYKGTGEALAAVMANQVPLTFTGISSARPAVNSGKLRALAVTGGKRNEAMPDVPTFDEAGLPGVDSSTHWQMLAPAGTPRNVVTRLNAEINKVLKDREIEQRVLDLGYVVAGGSPDELAALNTEEIAKWTKVIQAAHISVE